MRMKKFICAGLVAGAAFFGGALQAQASCTWVGKIVYVLQQNDAYGGQEAWIYLTANSPTPTTYRYFYTNDFHFMDGLMHAHMGNIKVKVTGNASTCGSGAFYNGGTVTNLYVGDTVN